MHTFDKKGENRKYDLFLSENVPTMSDHVGCRLIFFFCFVGSQLYFPSFVAPSKTSRTKEELKEVNLAITTKQPGPAPFPLPPYLTGTK